MSWVQLPFQQDESNLKAFPFVVSPELEKHLNRRAKALAGVRENFLIQGASDRWLYMSSRQYRGKNKFGSKLVSYTYVRTDGSVIEVHDGPTAYLEPVDRADIRKYLDTSTDEVFYAWGSNVALTVMAESGEIISRQIEPLTAWGLWQELKSNG